MCLALVHTLPHLQTLQAVHGCRKILPQYDVSNHSLADAVNFHSNGGSLAAQQAVWDHGSLLNFSATSRMVLNPQLPGDHNSKTRLESCWIDNTVLPTRERCFFDVLGPIVAHCRSGMSSFGKGDEEKRFCLSEDRERFLISIGSNDQWGFEEAALSTGKFDRIHVFDCTLKGDGRPKRMPRSIANRVKFYPWCLATNTYTARSGRRFGNYTQLMALTNEKRAPELLKMDIEGWEWEVLPSLLHSSVSRDIMPRQIAFELHVSTYPLAAKIAPPSFWRTKTPGEVAALMAELFAYNYALIDRRDNPKCPHCTEIVLADICTRGHHKHRWGRRRRGRWRRGRW